MGDNLEPAKTYIIQHKVNKKLWSSGSGKRSWKKPGHAKAAWKYTEDTYFDKQTYYEIVELKPGSETLLEESIVILKIIDSLNTTSSYVRSMISEFLVKIKKI